MNGAPDWQDGECCFRCRTQFSIVARKHHCRNCGNIFCAKCSSQQIPLPKLNIERNVRVCDTCYEKIASKNEDPLTLALSSSDKEQSKTAKTTTHSKSSGNKQSTNNASAPSEQELKEEEELQLALALSLSEAPTKVSFPDCRHFDASTSSSTQASAQINKPSTSESSSAVVNARPSSTVPSQSNTNGTSPQRLSTLTDTNTSSASSVNQYALNSSSVLQKPQEIQQQPTQYPLPQQPIQSQPSDYQIPVRDMEVFRYVGEVQSTLEIFNNRLESCKLRNRPVANDAAIQSLFLKLSAEFQPKLTEFLKTYEDERASYERLQDKLSQIADARAALDALREEHQEKVRQQAAEAERQRQSQLATKLEAMRQKKSQMMQYQRELALQRIREQEMNQPSANAAGYQVPPPNAPPHLMAGQPGYDPMQIHDPMNGTVAHQQVPTTDHQDWNMSAPNQQQYMPTYQLGYAPSQEQQLHHYQHPTSQPTTVVGQAQQQYAQVPPATPAQPAIDRASMAQLERQFLPNSKPEEEPLISFDD